MSKVMSLICLCMCVCVISDYRGSAGRTLQSPSYTDSSWRRRTSRSPCVDEETAKFFYVASVTRLHFHQQRAELKVAPPPAANKSEETNTCMDKFVMGPRQQELQVSTIEAPKRGRGCVTSSKGRDFLRQSVKHFAPQRNGSKNIINCKVMHLFLSMWRPVVLLLTLPKQECNCLFNHKPFEIMYIFKLWIPN